MTRNQLEYWKNQETERHNLAMEQQGLLVLQETQRANRANEQINASSVQETGRSNRARELETHRANLASEYQNLLRYQETVRSNQASEEIARLNAEIARQNIAVGWANVAVAQQNALVNQQNAVTNRLSQWDTSNNNARRNDIQAASNPFTYVASSSNLLTNLKSFGVALGGTIVKSIKQIVNTPKPSVTTSKPATQKVSNYLAGTSSTTKPVSNYNNRPTTPKPVSKPQPAKSTSKYSFQASKSKRR